MKYATVGSVSHGTLRNEDLLDSFASELEYQIKRQPKRFPRRAFRKLITEANRIDPDDEFASELICELQDALETFAAPYQYFGTCEGDGADFGFWLCENWREQFLDQESALIVDDTADIPREYRGEVMHVSDHGNLTLYVKGAGTRLREIWGIV